MNPEDKQDADVSATVETVVETDDSFTKEDLDEANSTETAKVEDEANSTETDEVEDEKEKAVEDKPAEEGDAEADEVTKKANALAATIVQAKWNKKREEIDAIIAERDAAKAEVETLKAEISAAKVEQDYMTVAAEKGIDVSLLRDTGLQGDALVSFADKLSTTISEKGAPGALLRSAVKSSESGGGSSAIEIARQRSARAALQ